MTNVFAFTDACQRVFTSCPDQYAKAYARAGMGMVDRREISTQALYILNNIKYWRGDEAKTVRTTLKQFV